MFPKIERTNGQIIVRTDALKNISGFRTSPLNALPPALQDKLSSVEDSLIKIEPHGNGLNVTRTSETKVRVYPSLLKLLTGQPSKEGQESVLTLTFGSATVHVITVRSAGLTRDGLPEVDMGVGGELELRRAEELRYLAQGQATITCVPRQTLTNSQ